MNEIDAEMLDQYADYEDLLKRKREEGQMVQKDMDRIKQKLDDRKKEIKSKLAMVNDTDK